MKKTLLFVLALIAVGCGPPDGPYETYHDNGQLWEKGTYRDGDLDGLYEGYYENGQLKEKVTYRDGEKEGLQETYYNNGQLWTWENYKNGHFIGLYEVYSNDGQLRVKGFWWDSSGKCGEWLEYGETVTYPPCPPDLADGN